jgi:hypothetical protein
MGLPCHHEIRDRLQEQDVLHLSDIYQRWHFVQPSLELSIGQPLLMNPRVIKPKGRPQKSKGKTLTRRDPSAFEVEAAKAERRGGRKIGKSNGQRKEGGGGHEVEGSERRGAAEGEHCEAESKGGRVLRPRK